jgi:DNA-binding phage protein
MRSDTNTRNQLKKVCAMLGHKTVGIAQIARETGLTRQTVYRIKDDPRVLMVLWALGDYEHVSGARET